MKSTIFPATSAMLLALALTSPTGAVAMGDDYSSGSAKATFNSLDTDNDGYLTKQEAAGRSELVNNWDKADENDDMRIDSAEFSAFEVDQADQTHGMDKPDTERDMYKH